jgi:DNA-directed RNA polymerase subunit RPC12/RpoP
MLSGMDAVRCLRCGETRWSFLPGTIQHLLAEPCESCGGRVVRERRRPGTAHATLRDERRERGPRSSSARV